MRYRITYNAPLVLTFALVSTALLVVDALLPGGVMRHVALGGRLGDWTSLWRLVTYPFGHADWQHLVGNMSLLLLLGPSLEERYGWRKLAGKMLVTAVLSGLLNLVLFDTGLIGASGIVFMLIVLSSFVNVRTGEVPLTFLLVLALFLSQEIVQAMQRDQVSQFAHLMGGALGAVFGFGGARPQPGYRWV